MTLGSTHGVEPLRLGMVLGGDIDRLYEVDVAPRHLTFRCEVPTAEPGVLLDATIRLRWRVQDPVRAAKRPSARHHELVLSAVQEALRAKVADAEFDDLEQLADTLLDGRHLIPDSGLVWGEAVVAFAWDPTGRMDDLARVRRRRAVDREERALRRERIEFYAGVINSGPVDLLALWLSGEEFPVEEVLNYIRDNGVPYGEHAINAEDPLRDLMMRLFSDTDGFVRNEMRLALCEGLRSRDSDHTLVRLREALSNSNHTTNGLSG
ncbi:MAG: hypothetical protein ACRDQ5_09700 [Sciscionella sp.]